MNSFTQVIRGKSFSDLSTKCPALHLNFKKIPHFYANTHIISIVGFFYEQSRLSMISDNLRRFKMSLRLTLFFGLTLIIIGIPLFCAADEPDLRGAWRVDKYILKNGEMLSPPGTIIFTEKEWLTVFIITDEDKNLQSGNTEGGTYSVNGNQLVFKFLYNIYAGQKEVKVLGKPAGINMKVMDAANASSEECTFKIEGEVLTIYFPSGNRFTYNRSSGY